MALKGNMIEELTMWQKDTAVEIEDIYSFFSMTFVFYISVIFSMAFLGLEGWQIYWKPSLAHLLIGFVQISKFCVHPNVLKEDLIRLMWDLDTLLHFLILGSRLEWSESEDRLILIEKSTPIFLRRMPSLRNTMDRKNEWIDILLLLVLNPRLHKFHEMLFVSIMQLIEPLTAQQNPNQSIFNYWTLIRMLKDAVLVFKILDTLKRRLILALKIKMFRLRGIQRRKLEREIVRQKFRENLIAVPLKEVFVLKRIREIRSRLAQDKKVLNTKQAKRCIEKKLQEASLKNQHMKAIIIQSTFRQYSWKKRVCAAKRGHGALYFDDTILLRPDNPFTFMWSTIFTLVFFADVIKCLVVAPREIFSPGISVDTCKISTLSQSRKGLWKINSFVKKMVRRGTEMHRNTANHCSPISTSYFGLTEMAVNAIELAVFAVATLDIPIRFCIGELDAKNGVLKPTSFIARWLVPGLAIQVFLYPRLKHALRLFKHLFRPASVAGHLRIMLCFQPILLFISQKLHQTVSKYIIEAKKNPVSIFCPYPKSAKSTRRDIEYGRRKSKTKKIVKAAQATAIDNRVRAAVFKGTKFSYQRRKGGPGKQLNPGNNNSPTSNSTNSSNTPTNQNSNISGIAGGGGGGQQPSQATPQSNTSTNSNTTP